MVFDNIHNYYEIVVVRRLNDMLQAEFIENDPQYLEDVACVALNRLPSRYVKHDIDLFYYMTMEEREKIDYEVHKAITLAVDYVNKHRNDRAKTE